MADDFGKPVPKVLDPLRGQFDLSQVSKDDGVSHPDLTSKDIILRDYSDVEASDIVLVNLNLYGADRPSIGTFFELAWAWGERKMVIGVAEEQDRLVHEHPFLKEAVAHYFNSVEDACKFIAERVL